ncbi:MAG TPA: energy-coupling factor transporter ATPase [Candidatus Faeciplasma pullistercoris]|uniref:Energy-coupling factor transporter ATP-binding protein EcfA2 n=1 Tax=Candidatus Faeciplasma pullistercoris TaxID=2840800 RepID=A0A9D1KKF5_9FIRM|nr:energy-coupling factor transporter ATPase [Candidatus Faeciplasma pullistercoris]
MGIIRTENLTYIYGEGTPFRKVALDNVNIDIEEGELVGIIGHTGSGKSTLIQHFNGLLKPTSGKVFVDGEELFADKSRLRDIRFKVGLVFQYPEYQLFEETVYRDIAFGPKNMGLSDDEIDRRVKETMRLVELKPELADKSPFELSGGQKRRVAIAGVMAMEPKVLILDEPTAGLDPRGRDRILRLIKDYHEEKGSTVMLVSHSMEDIAKTVSKILVMDDSNVYMYDTPEKVFAKARELDKMGLTVPQITRVFDRLKQSGIEFSDEVYSVEYAKKLVLRLLEDRRV